MKDSLPDFILPNQSAFVKNRLLLENLLLATELVSGYHKNSISARCAIKFDISKAFDSVEWSFLLNVLHALHFPDKFIKWIALCVTTASFSVQVNGDLAGFFQSKHGLRQGCSLSPYLFVICMNILSTLLDKSALEREFGFHQKCRDLTITHLCFADDMLVFTDGSLGSIEGVVRVFDRFARMSGIRINMEKTVMYVVGLQKKNNQSLPISSLSL